MSIELGLILVIGAAAATTDLRTGRIPNMLTYSLLAAVFAVSIVEQRAVAALWGMLCAGGALALLHYGTGGRGLGFGDVKFAAGIGAALGVQGGLQALAVAFITGALVGITGLLCGRFTRGQRLPFAPYLTLGAVTAACFPALLGGLL